MDNFNQISFPEQKGGGVNEHLRQIQAQLKALTPASETKNCFVLVYNQGGVAHEPGVMLTPEPFVCEFQANPQYRRTASSDTLELGTGQTHTRMFLAVNAVPSDTRYQVIVPDDISSIRVHAYQHLVDRTVESTPCDQTHYDLPAGTSILRFEIAASKAEPDKAEEALQKLQTQYPEALLLVDKSKDGEWSILGFDTSTARQRISIDPKQNTYVIEQTGRETLVVQQVRMLADGSAPALFVRTDRDVMGDRMDAWDLDCTPSKVSPKQTAECLSTLALSGCAFQMSLNLNEHLGLRVGEFTTVITAAKHQKLISSFGVAAQNRSHLAPVVHVSQVEKVIGFEVQLKEPPSGLLRDLPELQESLGQYPQANHICRLVTRRGKEGERTFAVAVVSIFGESDLVSARLG